MCSRPGKSTTYQYLCFSNGIKGGAEVVDFDDEAYIDSRLPTDLLYEKIKAELQGNDTDMIQSYISKYSNHNHLKIAN